MNETTATVQEQEALELVESALEAYRKAIECGAREIWVLEEGKLVIWKLKE